VETVLHTLDNFGLRCGTHKGVLGHIHIKAALQNETSRKDKVGIVRGNRVWTHLRSRRCIFRDVERHLVPFAPANRPLEGGESIVSEKKIGLGPEGHGHIIKAGALQEIGEQSWGR
jgi:hypothetical protein